MKTRSISMTLMGMMLLSMSATMNAQSKVETSIGADVVSSYIWRGTNCGGISVQPSLSASYKGFSLGAWGSVGLESTDTKEVDFTLGYSNGGFSLAVTDYWFDSGDTSYFKYGAHSTAHVFEATIGYDFGAFAISWNTNFAGSDYAKLNSDNTCERAYSTYVNLSAPFRLGGLEWSAEVGFTPWEGAYADKLNMTNLTLKASKEIKITDSFSLPVFGQVAFNPYEDRAYFVFGLSF